MVDDDKLREGLPAMFPRALPEWMAAMQTLGPMLAAHYQFTRLDWCHFCGQIAAETNGLALKRMQEDMRFSKARMLQVYSYRLGRAIQKGWTIGGRQWSSKEDLAAYLVGKPDLLADVVYGDREGTPVMQGHLYIGRGPTQITHRNNYAAIAQEIARQPGGASCDLVREPQRLATDPELGVRSAFADWHIKGLSRWARNDDCDTVSDALNTGNIHDNVRAHGLPRRRAETARAKRIWGPGFVVRSTAAAPERLPPASMAESTTGNTSIAVGGGGATVTATEISVAVEKVAASGKPFSALELALALMSSPTFWVGVLTIAGAAYIWLERSAKLKQWGI